MQERIQKLQAKMELGLEEISQVPDPIQRNTLSIKLVSNTIEELKSFISAYTFKDKVEEIYYFKNIAPMFYSKDFYFIKIYEIDILKRTSRTENLRPIFGQELREIDDFFSHNIEFCRYYYTGSSFLDEKLFSRHNSMGWPLDSLAPVLDANFTISSYKISWIIANEKYRYYLEKELKRLDNPLEDKSGQKGDGDILALGGSKSYLAEEIVALQLAELIYVNGKPASLAWLTEKAEELLNTDLKDFKSLDYANRSRKKDITPLLTSMIKKYVERANRLIE